MINIKVQQNLQPLINKIDQIPIVIQSSIAEAFMGSEQFIRQSIFDEYNTIFTNYTILTNQDLSMFIYLDPIEVWKYEKITGDSYDNLQESIINCITNNVVNNLSKNVGGSLGT